MDEILEYLNTFKILLVLDNLETVLDEKIRSFLSRITSTSKVLITSRVGLGELEYCFPLRAMKDDEAVSLLRATAQVRRAGQIVRTNNTTLKMYCKKMKNNPLFIKWFVSSVQSGKRPEDALQNSSIFLDYCLSNVIEHLSADAQFLARAMVGIPGPHAQPMLAYITEMDGDRLQLALQQLVTANVAILNAQPTATGYESLYDLGDLPRLFLLKSHPPSPTEIAAFGKRRSELARAHEQIKAQVTVSPYSPNSVAIRTRDDVVVAKYLTDAMQALRQKRFEDATAFIEKAKKIAPGFAEVYRVEGWSQYFLGNAAASREAYETAVELEPRSAAVRYWYAGFLLRAHHDAEAARQQLRIAHEIDPGSPEIRVEYARALSYLFKFDEADDQLRPVIRERSGSTKLMRVAYDGWIQIAVRRGNFRLGNSDYLTALEAYETATERFSAIPEEYRDRRIIKSVSQCTPQALRIIPELTHSDAGVRAQQLKETLDTIRNLIFDNEPLAGSQRAELAKHLKVGDNGAGQITRIDPFGKFGFISVDSGGELFFHRTQMDIPNEFSRLKEGDPVSFIIGENSKGLTAERVNATHSETSIQRSERLFGVIARAVPERSFGFILSDDGREYFFHRSELKISGQHMSGLKVHTPVSFTPSKNEKGPVALSIELVVDDAFLDTVFREARKIVATVSVCKEGMTYGFAIVEGSHDVLLRSQDFRDPAAWDSLSIGDKVSFILAKTPRGGYLGRDIEIADRYWGPQ